MQDLHTSTSREKTFLVSCQKPPDTCHHVQGPIEETQKKNTHGFLHYYHPPACQGIPVATTDRSEKTQCQAKKTGDNEQTNVRASYYHKSDKEGKNIFHETMNHMAKQRVGSSGQHLQDFETLPSAVVKVARA